MATVKITLCSDAPTVDSLGRIIPNSSGEQAPRTGIVLGTTSVVLTETVSGNTEVTSLAIPQGTLIRLQASAPFNIRIGASPTAVAADAELVTNLPEFFVAPIAASEVSVRLI